MRFIHHAVLAEVVRGSSRLILSSFSSVLPSLRSRQSTHHPSISNGSLTGGSRYTKHGHDAFSIKYVLVLRITPRFNPVSPLDPTTMRSARVVAASVASANRAGGGGSAPLGGYAHLYVLRNVATASTHASSSLHGASGSFSTSDAFCLPANSTPRGGGGGGGGGGGSFSSSPRVDFLVSVFSPGPSSGYGARVHSARSAGSISSHAASTSLSARDTAPA
eukprot:31497-Pelagococcus_subviridis.AAC.69